jgi:hypothetical protein
MENQVCDPPASDGLLDLGLLLGQNQAFGLIAGRCSAAQAEGIRRIRTEKLYKRVTEHWKDFCAERLGMSGTQADYIIRLWEEFGAGYFEVAQLTRVSPETYRALEPDVENGVLHLKGEQIELTLENSRRVAAAVAEVRRSLSAKSPLPALPDAQRFARLDRFTNTLIEEFEDILHGSQDNWSRYRDAVLRLHTALSQLREEMGI